MDIAAFYVQLNQIFMSWGYLGLFLAAALAASIVPFPSELIFAFCVTRLDPVLCVVSATLGNVLGGITLYWMGMLGKVEWLSKCHFVKYERVRRMRYWMRHKGAPIAFFGFLPAIGQAIIIVLGMMRCNIYRVTFFMALGKCSRYIVVAVIIVLALNK